MNKPFEQLTPQELIDLTDEQVKEYLDGYLSELPKLNHIGISMYFWGNVADLDNKAFFWTKMVQDYMTNNCILEDDDVKHISKLHYEYKGSSTEAMVIKLEEL